MHERAVANAGPLVALSLLGRLDLLPSIFREVWIHEAVQKEVVAGLGRPGARELQGSEWSARVRAEPTSDALLVAGSIPVRRR